MKFEIQQDALQKSLDLVSGIVPSKTTLPILRCILLEARENGISLSVTNLDVSMVTTEDQVKVIETGKVAVMADKLTSFVRSLGPGSVVFSVVENMLSVRSGKASCEIPCSNTEEYPALPALVDHEALKIPGGTLSTMVAETSYAVSRDETRPALMGILWEVSDNELTMVATDAHRLSRSRRTLDWSKADNRQMIVDTSGLRQLSRVVGHGEHDGDIEVFLGDNQLSFRTGKTILHTRLLEGPFPDYNAVIPSGNDKLITIDREVLAQAIKRVSIIADRITNQIRLVFHTGRLQLSARGTDGSRADDEIAIGYDGESLEIGFNFAYLLDVLKNIQTETVQMSLRDTNSAALLVPLSEEGTAMDSLLCLLMPLRLAGE